jgi:two-component system chemotaxis response regulator CheV
MSNELRAKDPSTPLGVFYFNVGPDDRSGVQTTQFFGCDILLVRELVQAPASAVSHVPGARPPVEGFVTIRGVSMPLLDLRRALGLGDLPMTETLTCLVVEHRNKSVALRIAEPGSISNVTYGDVKALDMALLNKDGLYLGLVDDQESHQVISMLNITAFLDRLETLDAEELQMEAA